MWRNVDYDEVRDVVSSVRVYRAYPPQGEEAKPSRGDLVMKFWYPDYPQRDWALIDYQPFQIRGCEIPFRGPAFDPFSAEPGSYFSCLGAAQTYGCFYERPYPTLVSEAVGMPVLNLAVGGAGPRLYTLIEPLIDAINRGRFVILQCMSGRSESNARYEAHGYVESVRERSTGKVVTSSDAWHAIAQEGLDSALERIQESRRSWIESTYRLLDLVKVPVIFFWYSRREPDYVIDAAAIRSQIDMRMAGEKTSFFLDGLVGDYPQVIDADTMQAAAERCQAFVKSVGSRGMNQPLLDRFTGEPFVPFKGMETSDRPELVIDYSKNAYYPSAEMHEDGAAALLPTVRRLLEGAA